MGYRAFKLYNISLSHFVLFLAVLTGSFSLNSKFLYNFY